MPFPSPLSAEKLFGIKSPDLRSASNALQQDTDFLLNRLISTTDLEDPTIKVQSFRDRIFNNTVLKSGSKIDSLQAGDFSSFLKRAAFINPSGLQSELKTHNK